MAKLFTLTGATVVAHPDLPKPAKVNPDGSFTLPDDVAAHLHRVHINGSRVWETPVERDQRLTAEADAADRDPKALLAELKALRAQVESTK